MNYSAVKNIFTPTDISPDKEVFEDILVTPHLKLERIISKGHVTPTNEWYNQEKNEWVMLLRGGATLKFEEKETLIHLSAGDYITIPAYTKHRVEWTNENEETVWLALFY